MDENVRVPKNCRSPGAGKGPGWHEQEERHRNAALYGRAGGNYAGEVSPGVQKEMKEHPWATPEVAARIDADHRKAEASAVPFYGPRIQERPEKQLHEELQSQIQSLSGKTDYYVEHPEIKDNAEWMDDFRRNRARVAELETELTRRRNAERAHNPVIQASVNKQILSRRSSQEKSARAASAWIDQTSETDRSIGAENYRLGETVAVLSPRDHPRFPWQVNMFSTKEALDEYPHLQYFKTRTSAKRYLEKAKVAELNAPGRKRSEGDEIVFRYFLRQAAQDRRAAKSALSNPEWLNTASEYSKRMMMDRVTMPVPYQAQQSADYLKMRARMGHDDTAEFHYKQIVLGRTRMKQSKFLHGFNRQLSSLRRDFAKSKYANELTLQKGGRR